ncbi:hypothetical protein [Capnocytophaga periodontitidis]|jgi:hypothetical protein|uniref:hypothetical protein n=1 Tax=Capnocytophaga periodontitidis TaxID=2795027 RepID=UPI0018E14876|nr:hypothetical protein [Capnocytophaga periodontitidis]MBI1669428.1 hypothetical protein [Capnocytophaga periodontitidis]
MATITITLRETGKSVTATLRATGGTSPIKLVITTEITGYTCLFIYGDHNDLDYESIVVPTYKMKVEKDGKVVASYNVTRDSWYSRGVINDNWGWNDDIELSNRCFEPANGNVNLYATRATAYPPGAGVDAFALRQHNSEELNAVPHTKRMQTFVNGKPIHGCRENLSIAKGVMIHIGGWFKGANGNKLAGSYGCFGIVPKAQISTTAAEAERVRKDSLYQNYVPANEEYKAAIRYILGQAEGRAIQVVVEKRGKVEELRTLKNQ